MILVKQKTLILILSVLFVSCATQRQVGQFRSQQLLITDSALTNAFVGIAVYDTETKRFIHQYNSNKYFVPASNTKIPTLYAGLKYLGEKLPGIQYQEQNDTLYLQPTGDPTFLHIDYKQHPVFDFLKQQNKPMVMNTFNWKSEALGFGWAWDDYGSYYMTERSPLPIYGNYIKWIQERNIEDRDGTQDTSAIIFTDPEVNWDVQLKPGKATAFDVTRTRTENKYSITEGKEMKRELEIPFVTNGLETALLFLRDTLHASITPASVRISEFSTLYSQPVDSMFKPLMHRSDNFFAEQTLMMVSNQLFGEMDEQKLIAHLLQNDLSGFPQKPKWVDGSGLSRYNLFTPEDFVWLLGKMKDEFGLDRLKRILPTGNTGTLRNYYEDETGLIFAKTGSLSGHLALSGFLITPKNKLLIFSVLVNNHYTSPVAVRRAVEKFLQQVRKEN
jgi:D-alanyl-D-alanine carboxypeptidase/D-alanyl-D-alanine-endopeptidase (penicillin-binding protein 4)